MQHDNPSIRILISCHKPVTCPSSDIYLPVQLGAAGATRLFEGMQPDDEGENISDRNFSFCELTAQYWAWKNLDCDYIGLCHYRRFFYFEEKPRWHDDHAQIHIPVLSRESIESYHLDEEELIARAVVNHDAIIPRYWNVNGIPTPDGPKKTIREHMIAYGLVEESTLQLLMSLCEKQQPEYLPYLEDYLNGSRYQGYNCFIMKRSLFEKLCSFEFDLLLAFDKAFDYSNLTTTRKRVAGYLGEILISVFFNRMIQETDIDVAQYPLTFFESTPSPRRILSTHGEPKGTQPDNVLNIVWRYPREEPAALALGIESIGRHVPTETPIQFDVIVNAAFDTDYTCGILDSDSRSHIPSWVFWPVVEGLPKQECLSDFDRETILPLILPWLTDATGVILWGEDLLALGKTPNREWVKGLRAARNVYLERELNRPKNRAIARAIGDDRVANLPGCSVLVIDVERMRSRSSLDEIIDYYLELKDAFKPITEKNMADQSEMLVGETIRAILLEELGFELLPLSIASQGLEPQDTAAWANEDTVREWKAAQLPTITVYGKDGAPHMQAARSQHPQFWPLARTSSAYEMLVSELITEESRIQSYAMRLKAEPLYRKILRFGAEVLEAAL